jgi:hypothetical protein
MDHIFKTAVTLLALSLAQASCGHDHLPPGGAAASATVDGPATSGHDPNDTTLIHEDGAEGPVSTQPHPADCTPTDIADTTPVATCANVVGTAVTSEGRCLVASTVTPTWAHEPPSSGPMYGMPNWKWGEHTEVVPRGPWVHNHSHGFVVLTYNCPSGCDAELATLRQVLHDRAGWRVIMTPDPLLTSSRFAAIAWTWVYQYDTPDEAALLCFIDQHEKHGPED